MTRMDATANEPNVFMMWHFFKTDRYLFNKFPIALFVIPTPPLSWVLFIPTVGNWEQKRGHGAAVPPMPLGSLFLTGKVGYGEYKKIIRFFAYPQLHPPDMAGRSARHRADACPGPCQKPVRHTAHSAGTVGPAGREGASARLWGYGMRQDALTRVHAFHAKAASKGILPLACGWDGGRACVRRALMIFMRDGCCAGARSPAEISGRKNGRQCMTMC